MSTDFFGGTTVRHPIQALDEAVGHLECVHTFDEGPMPTGVAVSHDGRTFVCFPKWGDDVTATVAELVDGECVPFPDAKRNAPSSDADEGAFVSVQSVVVDARNRLWVLDTGAPMMKPTRRGGPKLVCIDLDSNEVEQSIVFDQDVALPTTYLNDVRFDLRRGRSGMAFITDSSDSGPNGIIVVDLDSGEAWRRLHDHPTTKALPPVDFVPIVEGRVFMERPADDAPQPICMGADGIAISVDGEQLWYCAFASRRWYSVSIDALADRDHDDRAVAHTIIDEGDKGGASDGLEADDAGRIYATSYEHNAIVRRLPGGELQTLVHDESMLFPDTMAVATDECLYFTCNQLHRQARYQGGDDMRTHPYSLFRVRIDAGPVLLK